MPSFDEIINPQGGEELKTRREKRVERIAARRGPKIPKGTSYEDFVIDHYIADKEEKASITAKVVNTGKELLDVIDNVNRLGHAAGATLEKLARYAKRGEMPEAKAVGKAAIKGFKRERIVADRETLRILMPDFLKQVEEATSIDILGSASMVGIGAGAAAGMVLGAGALPGMVIGAVAAGIYSKVKGGDEADAKNIPEARRFDVLTPAFALTTLYKDPIMWIPVGWPKAIIKTGFGWAGKGAKAAGEAMIGAEKVEKILTAVGKTWYDDVLPHFNIRAIMKRKRLGSEGAFDLNDKLDTFKEAVEAAPLKRERQIVKAMTISEKKFGIFRWRNMVDKEGSETILRKAHEASDLIVGSEGPAYAKFIGVHVDDLMNARKLETILSNAVEKGSVSDDAIKEIAAMTEKSRGGFAKYAAKKIAEKKGLRLISKQLGNAEASGAKAIANMRWKASKEILGGAIKNREGTIKILEGDLKNESGSLMRLLHEDVEGTRRSLNDLFVDLGEVVKTQAPEAIAKVKARLTTLRSSIGSMVAEEVDITKGTQALRLKSSAPLRHLEVLVRRLEMSVGEAIVGKLDRTTGQIIGDVKKLASEANTKLGQYQAARKLELGRIGGAIEATRREQSNFISRFRERTSNTYKDLSFLRKELAKEKILYRVSLGEKIPRFAAKQAIGYEKAFNALSDASTYQKFLGKFKAEATDIIGKKIGELPTELQGPAWNLRKIWDEEKLRLATEGLTKGIPFGYAPRAMLAKHSEEYGAAISRTGFLKGRVFETEKEFSDWSAAQGFKKNEDAFALTFNNLISADMAIARKRLNAGVEASFGSERIPIDVQKSLKWLFHPFSKLHEMPFIGPIMSSYGSVLHFTKTMLTGANVAFYGRNILGYPRFAANAAGWKAMLPWNILDNAVDSIKIMGKAEGKIGEIPFDTIRKASDDFGYFASSQTRGNIGKSFDAIANRYSKMNPMYWITNSFAMAANVEDFGRMNALVASLKKGQGLGLMEKAAARTGKPVLREAMLAAQKAMFDYNVGLLSPADKAIDGVFGFWSFRRRNIPRQLMTVIEDPKQYAVLSKALNSISNRESLTDEEINHLNAYQKDTFLIFGQIIDGIREVTRLGFLPEEDAAQTLRPMLRPGDISDRLRGVLGSRVSPIIGSFFDWYYGKSSFSQQDLGNQLPAKYTAIIKGPLRKVLGLKEISKPKYRMGQVVGEEKVLVGDPDMIYLVRGFPVWSRTLNEVSSLVKAITEGKPLQGAAKAGFGISTDEYDLEKQKKIRAMDIRKGKIKAGKKYGMKTFEQPYMKADEKRAALERLRGY